MKTSINIFNRLTNKEMKHLTSEVVETIANVANYNRIRSFSSTDLWDIQRRKRSISIRRYSL